MAQDPSSPRSTAGSACLADLVDASRSADPENPCALKLGPLIWGASRLGDVELLGQLLRMHSATGTAMLTWAPKEGPDAGLSSLCTAAKNGHVEVVRMLLEVEGPKTWPKTSHNRFALGYAAFHGHSDVVCLLLDAGIKPDARMDWAFSLSTGLKLAIEGRHEGVVEKLLSAGAYVDKVSGAEKETPLHVAARNLHEGFVEALLKAGADPNRRNASGETPLLQAAGSSEGPEPIARHAVISLLLDAGAKLATSSKSGFSTLHAFAVTGDDDMVERLISSGVDVDQATKNRWPSCNSETALHFAAENGHDMVVQKLLEAGADVDAFDSNDKTPLHRACRNGHLGVVKRLMEADADIFLTCNTGEADESPVDLAAAEGHIAVLKQLILAGEDKENLPTGGGEASDAVPILREGFEDEDVLGQALLTAGREIGHARVVRLFNDVGFDINYQDASGDTAFMRAAFNGHFDVIHMMLNDLPHADLYLDNDENHTAFYGAVSGGHDDIVELFMESPRFDINRASTEGTTPLHLAVDEHDDAVVERLLSLKADPNLADEQEGETPLMKCLKSQGPVSVLLKLLEGGADPNKPDDDGNTPLMHAAENSDAEACDALLRAGADVDTEHPHDGLTALEMAVDSESMDVALLLLRRGASKMNKLTEEGLRRLLAWQEEDFRELESKLQIEEMELQRASLYLSKQVEAWCKGVAERERRRNITRSRERLLQADAPAQ